MTEHDQRPGDPQADQPEPYTQPLIRDLGPITVGAGKSGEKNPNEKNPGEKNPGEKNPGEKNPTE